MGEGTSNKAQIELIAPTTLPRRFFVGAGLAGAVIGGASLAGWIGSLEAPEADAFRFSRGVALAPGEEGRLRAFLDRLAAEQRFQLRITGHTGTEGDSAANQALSESRAEWARDLALSLKIAPERLVFVGGLGGDAPLAKREDETAREYQRRLARVEIEAFVQ